MASTPDRDEIVTIYNDAGDELQVPYARSLVLLSREGYRKTAPGARAAKKTAAKRTAKKTPASSTDES